MLGELIPCGGGDPIPLTKAKLLIGRRSSCDICLQFPNVSSHHCEVELINGFWYVRDLNSRNGIKINGVRCDAKWLMPGDILSVSKHRYEAVYTSTGETPPPVEEDPFAIGLLEKAGLTGRRKREASNDDVSFPGGPIEGQSNDNSIPTEGSTISDLDVFDPENGDIPLEWLTGSDDGRTFDSSQVDSEDFEAEDFGSDDDFEEV